MKLERQVEKFASGTPDKNALFQWHFEEASRHYKDANAEQAIRHFRECVNVRPDDWRTWIHLAIVNSQLIGDLDETVRLLRYARRLREQLYSPASGTMSCRYLHSMWAAQIGHIANIEHLVKREILLGRDPKNLILHHPLTQQPGNSALLEKMGAYISIVRDDEDLPYPQEAMLSVLEDYYLTESLDGIAKHWWHASAEIFRAWENEQRAPLLALSEEEMVDGHACLRALGMPDSGWFACLHVREGGFKRAQGHNAIDRSLNAEVAAYLPAIRAITERGGWVVRIGDSSMQPLPTMPRLIDYAHSEMKSEWMDVFLLGACRLYVGTSSGPAYVPPLFGVPCVLTNWAPTGQRPFNARDIYTPKLYKAGSPPKELSLAEIMAPPVGHALRYAHADEIGLTQEPNTPEEIREVVIEMLDGLDGTLIYTDWDEALQSAFDTVAEANSCIGNARVGRRFLWRHSDLLIGPGPRAA